MKAAFRTTYGGPEVLEIREVPRPVPGPREVLIKIYATTVNRTDCGILTAQPFIVRFFTGLIKPSQKIPGTDFAGEVMAVGTEVTKFEPGQRVFGLVDNGQGSQAQYACMSQDKIARMPDNITYARGAASLEGAHYAYNIMNKVSFKKGDPILVNGATGAIGSALVQLLTVFGARVTAVCPGAYADQVKEMGAIRIIDYKREDFTQDSERFRCVFDAVGKSTFGQCKKLLYPKGVYISSDLGPGAQNIWLSLLTPLGAGKKVKFPIPTNARRSVELIRELIEKGKFKPLIDRSYSLDEIQEAYTYVLRGEKIGNVIVLPQET